MPRLGQGWQPNGDNSDGAEPSHLFIMHAASASDRRERGVLGKEEI